MVGYSFCLVVQVSAYACNHPLGTCMRSDGAQECIRRCHSCKDVVATVDRLISVVDGKRAHAFNIIHSIIYY